MCFLLAGLNSASMSGTFLVPRTFRQHGHKDEGQGLCPPGRSCSGGRNASESCFCQKASAWLPTGSFLLLSGHLCSPTPLGAGCLLSTSFPRTSAVGKGCPPLQVLGPQTRGQGEVTLPSRPETSLLPFLPPLLPEQKSASKQQQLLSQHPRAVPIQKIPVAGQVAPMGRGGPSAQLPAPGTHLFRLSQLPVPHSFLPFPLSTLQLFGKAEIPSHFSLPLCFIYKVKIYPNHQNKRRTRDLHLSKKRNHSK